MFLYTNLVGVAVEPLADHGLHDGHQHPRHEGTVRGFPPAEAVGAAGWLVGWCGPINESAPRKRTRKKHERGEREKAQNGEQAGGGLEK